ncbi:MAG TPA: hypothetical protein VHL53_14185 [Acidimicrobiia bacterium]|nr:hypothetical protein [Acidimicrobiia bacterium]
MRTAIVAGALGLAVLAPSGAAVAQNRPPRDPNPPGYHHGGCHDGYDHGRMHHGDYDDQGNWHER